MTGVSRNLTAASLGELHETQRGIIRGNRLKRNVAVPLGRRLLLWAQRLSLSVLVVLLMLDGADGANLGVAAAEFALRIEKRMNVQTGRLRSSSQLAESEDQFLLQIVGEVILCSEEDDSPLRDFEPGLVLGTGYQGAMWASWDVLVTARSRRSSSELGALSHSTRFAFGNSRPMMGVTSKDSKLSRLPLARMGFAEGIDLVWMGSWTAGSMVAGAILWVDSRGRLLKRIVESAKGCSGHRVLD